MSIERTSPKPFLGAQIPNVKVLSSKIDEIIDAVNEITDGDDLDVTSITVADDVTADALISSASLGTAGTGVTAVHYGDGRDITTVLTFSGIAVGAPAGGANLAIGALIYTFPAGAHVHSVTYMSVALNGPAAIQADTPDIGIGSVIGSGVQALLSGVGATSEDYITGQTAADVNGTATVAMTAATAGALTGISLNAAASVKAVHLNVADGWAAGGGAVTATGTVTLKWTKMS
jgi:hypothetical protein